MPGFPIYNRFVAAVAADGGPDAFLDYISRGGTVKEWAERYRVSPRLVYTWIERTDMRDSFRAARRASADSLVADGLRRVDAVGEGSSPAAVAAARAQAEYRRWLAGRYDPDTYSDTHTAPQVHVSINAIHLRALQASATPPAVLDAPPAAVIEASSAPLAITGPGSSEPPGSAEIG